MFRATMLVVLPWFLPAFWAACLFLASSLSGGPPGPPGADKLVHAAVYGVLAFLLARALARTTHLTPRARLAIAIVGSVLYGLSDEWHQSFVPGRHPDPWDLLADTLGATIGACWWQLRTRH